MDYANVPVIPPPPGVQSNFEQPHTLRASLTAVNATFLPLMLIAVAIRLYVRGHIVHSLGWDDYTCVIAALGSVIHTILMLWDMRYGYGTHLWDIRLITLLPSHLQKIVALAILYPIVIFFVKLSIAFLIIRIFGVRKNIRYLAYFGILFCFLFYAAWMGAEIGTAVLCNSKGSSSIALCRHTDILTIISGVMNVVTDLYLLTLPISPVLGLNLRRQQKLGLLVVFLTGLIACSVSFARLIYVSVRFDDPDTLYNAALTSEMTSVELNIGIITASMSAMPQFFTKSRIFKLSTYSFLRLRLFSTRNMGSLSKRSKRSDELSEQNNADSGNDSYMELQDGNHSHAFAARNGDDEDGSSKKGILRSVDYDVHVFNSGV